MPQVETSGGLFHAANLGVVDIMKDLLGKYKADALIEEAWSNLWVRASPRNLHFAWCHDLHWEKICIP